MFLSSLNLGPAVGSYPFGLPLGHRNTPGGGASLLNMMTNPNGNYWGEVYDSYIAISEDLNVVAFQLTPKRQRTQFDCMQMASAVDRIKTTTGSQCSLHNLFTFILGQLTDRGWINSKIIGFRRFQSIYCQGRGSN